MMSCGSVGVLLLTCCSGLVLCLQYEPELFPGLIYRMKEPKIVLLIFVSGKVVLTGAWRCLADTRPARTRLHQQLAGPAACRVCISMH